MDWKKILNADRLRASGRKKDSRNEFESDYGRVLFSPALRRMHDKTQVFPLTADDNIHSRLTHSMEVMAIGYSLGMDILKNQNFVKKTGLGRGKLERIIPVILQGACLVHDIGNPPFGHFGETVIKEFFLRHFIENDKLGAKSYGLTNEEKEDFTFFDGNAQGFRILTKLQVLNDAYGLNLTLGCLGAYCKYPNYGAIVDKDLPKHKRGIFQSEIAYFKKVADGCGLYDGTYYKRHPLAFLMEAADSVCYLIMDLEDGFNKKWYNYEDIKGFFKGTAALGNVFRYLDKEFPGAELEVTRVVKFRIEVIRMLVKLASKNFTSNIDDIHLGTYKHELIEDSISGLAKKLHEFCNTKILPNREILSLEMTGHSVLSGLLKFYTDFLFHDDKKYRKKALGMISNSIIRAALLETGKSQFENLENYYKLRVIVDYISGMTDQFALIQYQKLSGQKIS